MKHPNWFRLGGVVVASLVVELLVRGDGSTSTGLPNAESPADQATDKVALGKELFQRDWLPEDRRSHGGDGLGPLFNARSCAACHNLGGLGGAGGKHTNVTLVSVFLVKDEGSAPSLPKPLKQPDRAILAEIHPNLRTENSFPLHRFATDTQFYKWHGDLSIGKIFDPKVFGVELTQEVEGLTLRLISSERNAPALFGVALIDRIPPRVLEEVAAAQARAPKEPDPLIWIPDRRLPISGRLARLKDGRIGRFGWKGQIATLHDFTLQACALELGLEVPGFPQTTPPWKPDYKAPGLDMTAKECDALEKFLASLPPPRRRPPETQQHAAEIAVGQKLFETTGCAFCHQPNLGAVRGIYSDLLLHDMGHHLSDDGLYRSTPILAKENEDNRVEPLPVLSSSGQVTPEKNKPRLGASSREWRTPPLWGLRDSAPYLHDGRADTISDAIVFHGGEGLASARKFQGLSMSEKRQLELFLQSLTAPEPR